MKKILIIDYGMGNLASVSRAFEECGAAPFITADPNRLSEASGVVLPGVGAFHDGMAGLVDRGWDKALQGPLLEQSIPLLGICLGMQLLADKGIEGGESQGLGLIPGTVVKLVPSASERIPHVGWNEVTAVKQDPLFAEIAEATDFYFVHSFHFQAADSKHVLSTTPYGGGFVSAVGHGKVFGVQFHPEKSSKSGFRLIRNFLSLC